MWIKVGTKGDYRVIYVILAFLLFLGLRSAYYSLYDLNGGPEKRSKIVRELDMVIRPDNVSPDSIIWLQKSNVTEYIGGARDFEETMFTDLAQGEIYELYKDNAKKKVGKKVLMENILLRIQWKWILNLWMHQSMRVEI